jgi:hypothetical protein
MYELICSLGTTLPYTPLTGSRNYITHILLAVKQAGIAPLESSLNNPVDISQDCRQDTVAPPPHPQCDFS